jgi:Zn finger protein HypA/HybF involved in hydrogenase expression
VTAKTFEDWWSSKEELVDRATNKLTAFAAWEAATKAMAEKFTSHNTGSHAICPECNNSVSIKELKALSQCPHCKVDYPFVVRGKQQASA